MDELFPTAVDSRPDVFKMDQDLVPPATESPNDDTDVQENALDNPTYEMDTGEQTNVDMPPPPPPDDDIPNDIDLIFDADDEIAANMDTDPSAVIDVNVVDENGDVVDEGDGNDIEDPDGVELPEYSYVDTVNEPVNEEAGPLPSKSMEDRRYESIKLPAEYLSEDELQRRKDKSLKICIGMFVVVLIGLAVGLIAFFITYSMRDLTSTTPEPTTEQRAATQPPIQIDYIVARLNITFNDKNFTEALNDPTSPEYQALFDEVTELINGLLQNGSYYADGNTTVVAFRPGSIVAVLVITFNALPDPLVVVLNDGGTDALADVIGQELVSLLTAGLSIQNAAVELSDVVIEEATTTVETTIGTTTEATGPAMPETTPESTPDTTPGTSPETSPETSPATSPVTSPIITPETTAASTTPELTCADDEFACDEGRCIDESAVCDFIPDCRVSRNDETEDLCEVSLLTDDISVTSRRNATLTIPDSYPSRTQDTPLDYILYRLTSPDNSYLLIDVVSLQSNGPDSIVTIGNGHDPVEANYLPDGIFQRSGINSAFPSTYYTPDNEAFVLLGRAAEEDVEMDIRISVFQCPQEDAVPCLRSSQCYLPSQICDNETHCQNGEDEQNCPNECVSCTTLWGGDIPMCLPLDWLCDGYQDCDDNLDELGCPTCFECPSGSFFDCVYDPEWVCDTYEDCNEGEDERNCPVFCPDGQFGCPWPDSVCIDETLICDFVPDCRVAGGDEAEEVCMVSQITDEIMVPFNEYKILRNPDSYPTRDVNTSSDYQLYKISSPPDSHLLIEIIRVAFDGTLSTVSVGSGLDPIEAFYDNGIVLAYTNGSGYVANPNPVYQTSPGNEAYILLEKAPEEGIEMLVRVSAFECESYNATPCSRSNHCYLEDEICDGTVQCERSGEDEQGCECGGDLVSATGSFSSPSYPNEYTHSRICEWRITVQTGHLINLYFDDFDIEDATGCTYDSVKVYNGLADNSPLLNTLCGSDTPDMISSSGNTMRVVFSTDGSIAGRGFQARYDSNDASVCGGQITVGPGGSGYIFSPQYGIADYSNNIMCEWTLGNSANTNSSLYLTFDDGFDLEFHSTCSFDYLQLFEGPDGSGVELERFCGRTAPNPYFIPFQTTFLRFRTDGSVVGEGFRMLYQASGCGGIVSGTSGVITSPNFPNDYNHDDYCAWRIDAPVGETITYTFTSFDIETHPNCGYDYLSIRNGGFPDSPQISGQYPICGSVAPSSFTSSGNQLFIIFKTDEVSSGGGFRMEWTTVTNDVCTGFVCETFFGNCLLEMYVCDGMPDCSDGTDELNCNVTEPPCFQCPSEPDCINLSYVCDGVDDCLDGSDEVNCTCPDDQYPCYFDDSICLDYTVVGCDGNYDCPGGTDEYNCTGCFACPGFSSCLLDLQVCDFYNDCPYGVDEAEDLCKHSEYISNFDIQVGVWTYFSEGFVRERTLDDRDTPASEFYDFTHYVFESPEGSTLFMEILNFTMNLTGPLLDLVGVSIGYWTNPTYFETVLAFASGYGNLESYTYSTNFTLFLNTGYVLIAMPKSVAGIFNMTFRVSAVECESPESPCYLSLHCLDMVKDYCDGEVQCLDSEEDEYGCEATEPPCFQCPSQPDCINASYVCDGVNNCEDGSDEVNCICPDGLYPCYFNESICYNYTAVGCDGNYDCPGGSDEYNCTGCFACNGSSSCLLDLQVCDFYNDCFGGEDETEELCRHTEFISESDIQVGVWTDFSEGFVRERTLDGRDTPASEFYDFTHYVFESPEGSTLFMEIQNLTVNLTGPLLELVRISAGVGTDPTDFYTVLAYSDGYGYFSSYIVSTNFSLLDNVGYLFIAIPKSVAGTFNINFRVTAVECEYPEELCYGSLHCLDRIQETCDGEVQCLDSGEDEYGCEECFNGQYCFYENKCVQPRGICDNGTYDCASGSDESQCPGCVPCNGTGWCPDDILVCDYWKDCPSGDDEAESLCNHTAFINEVNLAIGESVVINRSWLDGAYGDRDTPSSNFYNFTHYVFTSPPGTTLFVEMQNTTAQDDPGPLQYVFRVLAGTGTDPTSVEDTVTYFFGLDHSPRNFTIPDSVGYVLIAIPKGVQANVTFNVTVVDCQLPFIPCTGSPHCWEYKDRCDGETQCLYSSEDEHGCSDCFECEIIWIDDPCLPSEWRCDGFIDCSDESDELFCDQELPPFCCVNNAGNDSLCIDPSRVCDDIYDCVDLSDELSCATTPTTSSTLSPDTSSPTSPTVSPDTSSPTSPTVSPVTSSPTSPTTIPSSTPTTTSSSPTDQCNEFSCQTADPVYGNCISNDSVCDFLTDCVDGSDEEDCDCFKCPNDDECLLDVYLCDFLVDCEPDGADEDFCRHSDYIRPRNVTTGEWITIEQRAGDPVEYRGTLASQRFYFYHYVFQADSAATLFVEVLNFTGTADHSLDYHPIVTAGAGEDPLSPLSEEAYFDTFGSVESISSTKNFTLESSTGYVLLNFPTNTEAYVRFRVTAVACVDGDSTYCIGSPHCYDLVTECRDGTVQCLYTGEDEDLDTACPGP